jgi:hypothetical protein
MRTSRSIERSLAECEARPPQLRPERKQQSQKG